MENEILETLKQIQKENQEFRKEIISRFDDLNATLEGINSRFDDVNSQFEGINVNFDGINSKLDRIENR